MDVSTTVLSADGQVLATPGRVHWVLAVAGATGGAWQLNDSTDDSGTDLIAGTVNANESEFIHLGDKTVVFDTGIYADIPGTNVTVTVGYTER